MRLFARPPRECSSRRQSELPSPPTQVCKRLRRSVPRRTGKTSPTRRGRRPPRRSRRPRVRNPVMRRPGSSSCRGTKRGSRSSFAIRPGSRCAGRTRPARRRWTTRPPSSPPIRSCGRWARAGRCSSEVRRTWRAAPRRRRAAPTTTCSSRWWRATTRTSSRPRTCSTARSRGTRLRSPGSTPSRSFARGRPPTTRRTFASRCAGSTTRRSTATRSRTTAASTPRGVGSSRSRRARCSRGG